MYHGEVGASRRGPAAADPDYALDVALLRAWERQHGPIPPRSLVLMATGWDRRWETPASFLNLGPDGTPHFPGFGLEAARWLLEERQAAGLGTDTHGVDPGDDTTFAASRAVLARGGLVLENLARLGDLPPRGATLVVGLLPLVGGSGSPAAVLALVP